jgi:hypothetical protein
MLLDNIDYTALLKRWTGRMPIQKRHEFDSTDSLLNTPLRGIRGTSGFGGHINPLQTHSHKFEQRYKFT